MNDGSKVRLDKWLWSVRIFKSRSRAAEACRQNDVHINDKKAKASYLVQVGEVIKVKKGGFNLVFEVCKLIEKRVSAPLAVECYKNLTSQEELNKYKDWFIGKARPEMREKGMGRPTKKERREIDEYKEDLFL